MARPAAFWIGMTTYYVHMQLPCHGARRACQNLRAMREFPLELQDFAKVFSDLQSARHQADYALDGRYNKPDVLAGIGRAEMAIGWLEGADVQHRRRFAAHVLFKRRP